MADLGNQKIKDTYQLLLQTDASGNLQKLDGSSPNPFIINGNLRYYDGTQSNGYVLLSDGSGNASWGPVAFSGDVYISGGTITGTTIELNTTSGNTISIPGLKWSANTDGSISPSGDTTSVTIRDDLIVGDNITAGTDTFFVSATSGRTGIKTLSPEAVLSVKGGIGWQPYDLEGGNVQFVNGYTRCVFSNGASPANLSSGDEVRFSDGSQTLTYVVDYVAGSMLFLTQTYGGNGVVIDTLQFSSGDPLQFQTLGGSSPTFQISGTSVMSGSTDLLDIFATSAITNQDVYWSANTDGSISPSGLTTSVGIGTTTPNKPLTVVGDISGTTDLYLGDSVHTGSTIVAQEQLTIKGRGVDNDYMVLKQDAIDFHIDGLQAARFMPGIFEFNSSGYDYDFKINGEDQLIFRVYGTSGEERVRIKDHLAIGGNEAISHTDSVKWGLAVTGSSLFYSGGTSMSGNAITAVGDISGTTDLYIGGSTTYIGAVSGTGSVTAVGGFVGDVSNTTGYPESALPSSINAIKIADGTVTNTEFQYINTLVSNAQTQLDAKLALAGGTMAGAIAMGTSKVTGMGDPTAAQDAATKNYVDTRSHFVETTFILKLFAGNTWSTFNTNTGGLNTNGYWNTDTAETDIADAYTYVDTAKNTLYTTPYAGKIKRLLIQGVSQTGAMTGDDVYINLAKATITNGADRPAWTQVTATTKTLPASKDNHYIWDITIDMAVSQYDVFTLFFKNDQDQITWLPMNLLLEFEYTIT